MYSFTRFSVEGFKCIIVNLLNRCLIKFLKFLIIGNRGCFINLNLKCYLLFRKVKLVV